MGHPSKQLPQRSTDEGFCLYLGEGKLDMQKGSSSLNVKILGNTGCLPRKALYADISEALRKHLAR
jgi:hypothetical protein